MIKRVERGNKYHYSTYSKKRPDKWHICVSMASQYVYAPGCPKYASSATLFPHWAG